jgi:hypothetical protein
VTPCLLWEWSSLKGYGLMRWEGKVWRVHRLQWTFVNGPIPDGMWVLHSCDTPACYEITHLRLGTAADNAKDRDSRGRHGASGKTGCPQGHPYDYFSGGRRHCRTCRSESSRRRYQEKVNA